MPPLGASTWCPHLVSPLSLPPTILVTSSITCGPVPIKYSSKSGRGHLSVSWCILLPFSSPLLLFLFAPRLRHHRSIAFYRNIIARVKSLLLADAWGRNTTDICVVGFSSSRTRQKVLGESTDGPSSPRLVLAIKNVAQRYLVSRRCGLDIGFAPCSPDKSAPGFIYHGPALLKPWPVQGLLPRRLDSTWSW